IATHSPILMAYPGAQVYELTEDGIRAADYRETEHYRLTRRFLENPEKMLRYLLEE
ncbi:MAG TPA: ABC transporter ATP-binding protein, partial [Ruminococcaceae bacterium]|nr:ABC transporter ATP-binding protein [Oscillospiraceae bacterium]